MLDVGGYCNFIVLAVAIYLEHCDERLSVTTFPALLVSMCAETVSIYWSSSYLRNILYVVKSG